jgi:hypothetical protein
LKETDLEVLPIGTIAYPNFRLARKESRSALRPGIGQLRGAQVRRGPSLSRRARLARSIAFGAWVADPRGRPRPHCGIASSRSWLQRRACWLGRVSLASARALKAPLRAFPSRPADTDPLRRS